MVRTPKVASDTDRAMSSNPLGEVGSETHRDNIRSDQGVASEVEKRARQGEQDPTSQGVIGGLPSASDLTDNQRLGTFEDVLMDMLDASEEHESDSFDESLFQEIAEDELDQTDPEASSPIRRFAGAWQGGRRRPTTAAETSTDGPPADNLLENVLANSNAAPLAASPLDLDSVLGRSAPLDGDRAQSLATSDEAAEARANLAIALLFAEEDDPVGAETASDGHDSDFRQDALADLLAPDAFDEDLLDIVLGGEESVATDTAVPVHAREDSSSDRPAAFEELSRSEEWMDDLDYAMDEDLDTAEYAGEAEPEDDAHHRLEPAMVDAIMEKAPGPDIEPQDEIIDHRQTADMAAMQDLAGENLLADVLRDEPATVPTPVPFKSPPRTSEPEPRHERRRRAGMDELDHVIQAGVTRNAPTRKWIVRLIWLILLGGLLYVAFLPYRFEVGGEFVVQPQDRAEVRARTSGEITALLAREGDWVEAGDVIAVLSNWNQTRDLALIKSEGARLQAELATLMAGSRPEEITVAQEALAGADVQLATREQELRRLETLFTSGTVTQKAVEDARSARDLAQATYDQAAATLALVQAGPRETEIEALEATIAGNAEQQAFAELMLEYTNIRAPVAGQIVSSMNEVPIGYSLTVGGLFAEIEDNRTVIAELSVPEITIDEVEVGAPVELRLWSDPDDPITGTVRSISPRAEEQDFGRFIRVQVEVPNPNRQLAANITGFGKIEAEERPVWQAFSRAIQRFFVVEVWSWLP